jgi:hypothetical protein
MFYRISNDCCFKKFQKSIYVWPFEKLFLEADLPPWLFMYMYFYIWEANLPPWTADCIIEEVQFAFALQYKIQSNSLSFDAVQETRNSSSPDPNTAHYYVHTYYYYTIMHNNNNNVRNKWYSKNTRKIGLD